MAKARENRVSAALHCFEAIRLLRMAPLSSTLEEYNGRITDAGSHIRDAEQDSRMAFYTNNTWRDNTPDAEANVELAIGHIGDDERDTQRNG
jgi:hypothetical protein